MNKRAKKGFESATRKLPRCNRLSSLRSYAVPPVGRKRTQTLAEKNMNRRIIAICLLCAIGAGCATTHQSLIEHPKKTVRYPAKTGETVGYLAGCPAAIVCLPITLSVYAFNPESESARWAPLYPVIVTRDAVTTLIGGGAWLIFGWWGVPQTEVNEKPEVAPRLPRGAYVETPTGSLVVGDSSTIPGEIDKNDK